MSRFTDVTHPNEPKERQPITAGQLVAILTAFLAVVLVIVAIGYGVHQHRAEQREQDRQSCRIASAVIGIDDEHCG